MAPLHATLERVICICDAPSTNSCNEQGIDWQNVEELYLCCFDLEIRYSLGKILFIVIFIVLKYCNSFELPIEIVRNNWPSSTLIYIEIDNSMRIIYILLLNIV